MWFLSLFLEILSQFLPVGVNNCTYFLCLVAWASESQPFCATQKKGIVEFCFVVSGVGVTPCLLASVGLFCPFSMTRNTKKSNHSSCQSLIIFPCSFYWTSVFIFIYTVLTPVGTYIIRFYTTETWTGFMLFLLLANMGSSTAHSKRDSDKEPAGWWSPPFFHSVFFTLRCHSLA